MKRNFESILKTVYEDVKRGANKGEVAGYIPELKNVSPEYFGVCLSTIDNQMNGFGDYRTTFSIQSIVKVFSLCMAYRNSGAKIWNRIGVEPSGTPFNSLVQLESDEGIPRNPFVNAGAIVICDILLSVLPDASRDFLTFMRDISDDDSVSYSERVAASEKSAGYRNVALCNFIKSFGNIHNEPEDVLDFYFNICSIEMSCEGLSKAMLFLANGGRKTTDNRAILNPSQTKRINAIMQSCGHYDESGEFTYRVGLPGKSGVGGGIAAVHPHDFAIVVWSPRLNEKGNSYRGMKLLEEFTTASQCSIF